MQHAVRQGGGLTLTVLGVLLSVHALVGFVAIGGVGVVLLSVPAALCCFAVAGALLHPQMRRRLTLLAGVLAMAEAALLAGTLLR